MAGAPPSGPVSGVRLWGYGNSSGDHALLDMSSHTLWLGRPAKLPVGSAMFEPGPI